MENLTFPWMKKVDKHALTLHGKRFSPQVSGILCWNLPKCNIRFESYNETCTFKKLQGDEILMCNEQPDSGAPLATSDVILMWHEHALN